MTPKIFTRKVSEYLYNRYE